MGWEQTAWGQMPARHGGVLDALWRDVDARFDFRPGTAGSPAITEPSPSVTYDLSPVFNAERTVFSAGEDRLDAEVLAALKAVFVGQTLAVLDWQHDGYWFTPDAFDPAEPEDWAVTVFPNGDYHLFVTRDLSSGTFGHPWEQTLCVWGEPLLGEVHMRLAEWLPVRRRAGGAGAGR